ncbi:glycosyltransferase family 4 protein [Gloeobacter kilaueensis]|uniref:Glycosyl transferase group 1 n=1 Tax=Gloeobacter kilaueensis (strain ATCC BAA-2537 / CCAP 1431/1 / ULC 316 / JS1) TaxID=1183438 RepID=U5QP15_GLOK1|nr:glycosyltransferase family 4 protein [Gloeobacter kilaueensis]AGY60643.1 glycosyl transferase group 1 [Gloeobacter kilaueensis JS1]
MLHIAAEFPPITWGGMGTAVGGLCRASARAGMTAAVLLVGGILVLPEEAGPFSNEEGWLNADGVRLFQIAPSDGPQRTIDLVRRWQPDLLHLHTAWLWDTIRPVLEVTGLPFVFTVHSLDRAEYEIGRLVSAWENQAQVLVAANRIVVPSKSEAALLVRYYPEVGSRVRVAANGIDERPIAVRERRGEPPTVLFSGRFVERKGIGELLAAIPEVLSVRPTTRFVLAGGYGGPAEVDFMGLQQQMAPYRQQVHFTGWLAAEEMDAWYRRSDILVVPSWYEPFGMVVLEGMLHGLAVAATAVGGPAEILDHGRTGWLFASRNVDALKAALIQLVDSAELCLQLGAAAQEAVRRHWLWPQVLQKLTCVYREAIGCRDSYEI